MSGIFSSTPHPDLFGVKKEDHKVVKAGQSPSGMFSGLSVKKPPTGADAALSPPSVAPYPVLPKQDSYTPPQIPTPPRPIYDPDPSSTAPVDIEKRDSVDDKPSKLLSLPSKPPPKTKPDLQTTEPSWGRKGFADPEPESFAELRKRKEELAGMEKAQRQIEEAKSDAGRLEAVKPEPSKPEAARATTLKGVDDASKAVEKIEREKRAAEEKEKLRYQHPEELQLWIKDRLSQYGKQLEEKNKKQAELLSDTERLRTKLESLTSRKGETLEKQDQAAAEEDYEEAERLNTVVRELEVAITQADHDIGRAASTYQSYEDDKTEVYHAQKAFLADVWGKCIERKRLEEEEFHAFRSTKAAEEERKKKEIELETERVATESARLSQESEALETERAETQAHIEEHTHELLQARTTAQSELSSLELQIEELEAKLAELRLKRDQFAQKVSENDREIEERTSAFQDELYNVECKSKKLDQARSKLTQDSESLEAAKAALSAYQSDTKSALEAKEAKVAGLSACATDVKARQEHVQQLEESRKQYIETIEKNTRLMMEKEEELRASADYEKTVKETAEEVRLKVQLKRDRMAELEAKIPRLDTEKKALAAAKQYKDAARLANEVKSAITERESLSDEIERMRQTQLKEESHLSEGKTEEEISNERKLLQIKKDSLRDMLQEELKVTAFNKKKIMSEWRRIMRIAKTDELKREIEIYSQNHEREVDAKDAILQMLDRDLEEAEEQYQTALRNHLIHVDKLLALQDARLQGLGEEFKRDLDIILEEFKTERLEIVETHRMEMKELLDIMQAVEEEEKKKQDEAKAMHDAYREETKNKNSEDLVTLNTKLGMIAEKVERDFEHQYSNYEQNTKQMAEDYSSMYSQDKRASDDIKKLHRKIDYLNEEIASWKYKTQQNIKECQARNDALKREKGNVQKHYQELKKKMTQFREEEIRKLSKLTTDSRNCTLKLKDYVAMGEQILKLAELCRKLEDEKEKVMPFYASDAEAKAEEQRYLQQDREEQAARGQGESVQFEVGETGGVDSEIMRLLNPDIVYEEFRELEVFYKRFNKVLLDKLACENKKKALEKENKFFKSLLKQYLDGVSVNEDVMTQANPLFVVNNRIQLNRPPVEREGRQTVVEAAHVAQIRARAAM